MPHHYNDGQPYIAARGRLAPRTAVEVAESLVQPILELSAETGSETFLNAIRREMKIRFYQQRTIKTYLQCLRGFLSLYRHSLDELTPEDVRNYLELLVDGGAGSSHVSNVLAAVRTAFDKMCGLDITRGLMTPRKPSQLPVILSSSEVSRILQAAPSLRDKLLLGLMYASGLRVSEVVALKWVDIDFDRKAIRIEQSKGRKDRSVMLPESLAPLLVRLAEMSDLDGFLFPGQKKGRYLSPRSAQRAME